MADVKGKDVEGKLEKREAKPLTIYDYIDNPKIQAEIARGLAGAIDPGRFVRVILTALRENPRLQSCTVESIMAGVMTAAQLALEPNTPLGHAHLIPYANKKTGQYEANFQLGYQGVLELAYRTGEYQTIYAMEVYADDHFRYAYGLDPILEHIPDDEPEGEPTYYYAVYKLKNGGSNFVVWSKAKVEKHAKRFSRAFNDGPWKTDFSAMAKKTVVLAVLKYAPKSIELARQLAAEGITEREAVPPTFGAATKIHLTPEAEAEVIEDAEFEEVKPMDVEAAVTEIFFEGQGELPEGSDEPR